jgi:AcrR family transcriptional regulator
MNVRNEKDYLARKKQILLIARELILKNGLEKLSLRQVAKSAGYSPASLYEYFDNKEELINELAVYANRQLDKRMLNAGGNTPVEKLVNLGCAYVEFAVKDTEDFRLAFSHLQSQRSSFREDVPKNSSYGQVLLAVGEYLNNSGNLEKISVELFSYGLWALVHGAAELQIKHLKNFELNASYLEMIKQLILIYLDRS